MIADIADRDSPGALSHVRAEHAAAVILVESKTNEVQFARNAAAREVQNIRTTARFEAEAMVRAELAAAPPLDGAEEDELIPKPRGSGGSDYSIRKEMHLQDNKALYLAITVSTCIILHRWPNLGSPACHSGPCASSSSRL